MAAIFRKSDNPDNFYHQSVIARLPWNEAMAKAKLTKKELEWLDRFQTTMAAAPESLKHKLSSFTVGDNDITIYDKVKFDSFFEGDPSALNNDQCLLVEESKSEVVKVGFPFAVESTAG